MEILFAALLMIWGDASAENPDFTVEHVIQASMAAKEEAAQLAAGPPRDEYGDNDEWIKRDPQQDTAPVVRGLYATGYTAGGGKKLDTIIELINETELNAIVVDIKEDEGYITFDIDAPQIAYISSSKKMIKDPYQLMQLLEGHDIYPIARIVVFKDTVLANKRHDLTFLNPDGSVWHNSKQKPEAFVNPYKKEVWDYNIEVAKEAAKLGFKEIQFDYVRFPEGFEHRADILSYDSDERSREEVINDFTKYAREQLNPLGVRVSVDIFGYAASVKSAAGIGQDFNGISKYVDVISPMVYPSHYTTGWFGSEVPDAEPYVTINGAMQDTHKKLEELGDLKPIIRPWIQDFTAPWVKGYIPYGKKEVEAQIQALKDNGIEEFLLWNPNNVYTPNVNYTLE